MHSSILPACVYVLHVHAMLARPKESAGYSEPGATNGCELPYECQAPSVSFVRGAIS